MEMDRTFAAHVVIPWRGFRCFTRLPARGVAAPRTDGVVIPWRGFRCFTPSKGSAGDSSSRTGVVIPWRGFRCFTLWVTWIWISWRRLFRL